MTDEEAKALHARRDHPGYEYETTTGPRKTWDDQFTPPPGEGWEVNVDAGRDGWERFDVHEEMYWRRPLPTAEAERATREHNRRVLVNLAKRELGAFLTEWKQRHGLTLAEELATITGEVNSSLWTVVRCERDEAGGK